MNKVGTVIVEYEHCGKCLAALWSFNPNKSDQSECDRTDRKIPNLWGDIPDWCPLETKEVNND